MSQDCGPPTRPVLRDCTLQHQFTHTSQLYPSQCFCTSITLKTAVAYITLLSEWVSESESSRRCKQPLGVLPLRSDQIDLQWTGRPRPICYTLESVACASECSDSLLADGRTRMHLIICSLSLSVIVILFCSRCCTRKITHFNNFQLAVIILLHWRQGGDAEPGYDPLTIVFTPHTHTHPHRRYQQMASRRRLPSTLPAVVQVVILPSRMTAQSTDRRLQQMVDQRLGVSSAVKDLSFYVSASSAFHWLSD